MSRPDYVVCVRTGIEGDKTAWCGCFIGRAFSFSDPTHAALNGKQGGRLVACKECVDAITKALNNGVDRG